jgi:hypothetical protein
MARSTSRSTAWQRFSKIVGWVERLRETHHPKTNRDGFRFALPFLRSLRQHQLILPVAFPQQILCEIAQLWPRQRRERQWPRHVDRSEPEPRGQ